MNDLILIVYAIDLLVSLKALSAFLMTLMIFISFVLILIKLIESEYTWKPIRDTLLKYKRTLITVVCFCLTTAVVIPKERTLYIMSGLYVGSKMIHSASNNETFAKAEKLLNKKLDEMLGDKEVETLYLWLCNYHLYEVYGETYSRVSFKTDKTLKMPCMI